MKTNSERKIADFYKALGNVYFEKDALDYDYYNEGEQKSKNSSFDVYATNYFEKARAANGSKETKAKAKFMLAKTNYCLNVERNADYKYSVIV